MKKFELKDPEEIQQKVMNEIVEEAKAQALSASQSKTLSSQKQSKVQLTNRKSMYARSFSLMSEHDPNRANS